MVIAGEPAGSELSWLADVVSALLQQAQKVGLADAKQQSSRFSEGLAVPEALAWQDCFATFLDLIMRHLKTLCEVCRLAEEVMSTSPSMFFTSTSGQSCTWKDVCSAGKAIAGTTCSDFSRRKLDWLIPHGTFEH